MNTYLTVIARGNVEHVTEHASAADALEHVQREARVPRWVADDVLRHVGMAHLRPPATADAVEIRRL